MFTSELEMAELIPYVSCWRLVPLGALSARVGRILVRPPCERASRAAQGRGDVRRCWDRTLLLRTPVAVGPANANEPMYC
ncbi:hypothetical protein GCM10009837_67500 [Streptomyces durmitorensis]